MLHTLWSKAVGTHDYVKAEWKELDRQMYALMEAAKKAMRCLTGEEESAWQRSQSFSEAPYHFLWKAINGVQP